MHSVDLLEEALSLAMDLGFEVRQEWLDEQLGGACRLGDKLVLFVNLSQTAKEQLNCVATAVVEHAEQSESMTPHAMSAELREVLIASCDPS